MERSNPKITRFNCNERMSRKMLFYEKIHEGLNCKGINGGNEDVFDAAFNRFINQ